MNGSFLDVLVRHRAAEDVSSAKRLSQELNALCEQLAASLSPLERPAREELLHRVLQRVWGPLDRIDAEAAQLLTERKQPDLRQRPTPVQLTPDQLDCARQQVSEEEYLAGIRDIRENGGVPFVDILQRLKLPVGGAHE
jgi:hypothetical protein